MATTTGDMITLARLHAALDSVVETEQLIAAIRASARTHPRVAQVSERLAEARELLRWLLGSPA